MKVPALFLTLALASGFALAQSAAGKPAPGGAAPAMASGQPAATPTEKAAAATPKAMADTDKPVKKTKKAKAKSKKTTQSMGASAAPLDTDLTAKDRRARMDAAYASWQAMQKR
jgi:hypothetical protein